MHELYGRFLDVRTTGVPALVVLALSAVALLPAAAGAATSANTGRVTLVSPTSRTVVGETLDLRATATGRTVRAVRFQGRWTDADGVRRWHTVGTDRVASNGFSMRWSTSALKEQKAVYVRAVTLDRRGKVVTRSRSVRLSVPAAATAQGVEAPISAQGEVAGQSTTGVRQTVKGTCGLGTECKVNTRSGPGTSYARTGQIIEGATVDVVCQGSGETVVTLSGISSVWNKLADGSWVSDLYLDTAGKPGFSAAIPRC